ncbi:GTPase domain-containing protein, partial [Kitasatospora sp. NPDC058965]|uniref:GTPase domain-containing protein n=1 Tax=Kitasatospora sp. NPDC058965 TaxID=3346682 RepID=UPI00367E6DA8
MIESILARRARRAEELAGSRRRAMELVAALDGLEAARGRLPGSVAQAPGLAEPIARLREQCLAVAKEMDRTAERFRRPTLTLGMIGRSGQGKSRFLQSLTGLTDDQIPAGKGSFITGVPSHIRHSEHGPGGAEIDFHDERSFVEQVLERYYGALGLGPAPATVDEFARRELPRPPAESTVDQAAWDHLARYHAALPAYRDRLTGPTRTMTVPTGQLRRWVVQADEAGHPLHDFRAVRQVRISTPFGRPDLGRVSLIDLPGLGDTNLGDVELLRRALGSEVDVAVFLRRPDTHRYGVEEADVRLYEEARAALPEIPLERWSFMLVNRMADGTNEHGVQGFRDSLAGSRIKVVDVIEVDCTDPAAVRAAFDTLLGRLV